MANVINMTSNLSISERMKLVQGVARGIQLQAKPEDAKESTYLYDGNDKNYHNWWRAVINQLSGVYLDGNTGNNLWNFLVELHHQHTLLPTVPQLSKFSQTQFIPRL